MNDRESGNKQIALARWISVIGHPFLLMPLLTGIIAFEALPRAEAIYAEAIALGVVIVPAGLYTVYRVRKGTWHNIDVSDQQERGQFYEILLPLLSIIAVIAWIADVPRSIPFGALAIITLVATALMVNSWIKVSLHTGFGVFVALTLYLMEPALAVVALVLALFIAWSRVVLGRHTTCEVVLGGTLGGIVGGAFVITLSYLS